MSLAYFSRILVQCPLPSEAFFPFPRRIRLNSESPCLYFKTPPATVFARLSSCLNYSVLASEVSALDANVPRDSNRASQTFREALAPPRHRYVAHRRSCEDPETASSLQPVTTQRAKRYEKSPQPRKLEGPTRDRDSGPGTPWAPAPGQAGGALGAVPCGRERTPRGPAGPHGDRGWAAAATRTAWERGTLTRVSAEHSLHRK